MVNIMLGGISVEEALKLIELTDKDDLMVLFNRASEARKENFGNKATACSIINARCGGCSEDCAFCPQSAHSHSNVEYYPLVTEEEIVNAARQAEKDGAAHFGIVTSGRAVNTENDLETICSAIKRISDELNVQPCASLGLLDKESLRRLKSAGLTRYHNNLETAKSFFGEICTTRNFEDQVQTINDAMEVGLSVCTGGLFGMGESKAQRVEMLDTVRSIGVDSVPLNFLNPIAGTKLEGMKELTPFECLKIIAVARLMMPEKTIRVCGGRESNLRDFQSWLFHAGADGLMIGGYLVTAGREVDVDLKMIEDAGMELG